MVVKRLDNYLTFEFFRIDKPQTIHDFAMENMFSLSQLVYNSKNLLAGDIVCVTGVNKILHIVKPLETLNSIAKKYNVSVNQIMEENKIDKIFIGQQLFI